MTEPNRQTSRKSAPISRHPLFPAIVALWFGALFGLGSLAVRPSLLEEMVRASQIDLLIPAAAPPLGLTARILLALGMALLGGIIGATIARRFARPAPVVRQRRRGAVDQSSRARAYASAGHAQFDEEEDEDDADGALPLQNKRRSLAISEEDAPIELHDFAPLPGGPPQILNLADVDADPIREPAPAQAEATRIGADADTPAAPRFAMPEAEPSHPHEAIARLERTFAGTAFEEPARFLDREEPRPPAMPPAFEEGRPFEQPATSPAPFAPPAAFQPPFAPAPCADPLAHAQPEAVAPVAAQERATIALPAHRPLFAGPDAVAATPAPQPAVVDSAASTTAAQPAAAAPDEASTAPSFVLPQGSAAQQLTSAELDDLSPVQLVERLALSIQRRRERPAPSAPETVLPAMPPMPAMPEPRSFAEPQPEPVATLQPAASAPFAPPPTPAPVDAARVVPAPMAMPAALRPVLAHVEDEVEDDGAAIDLDLPPRFVTQQPPVHAPANGPAPVAEEACAADADEDEAYAIDAEAAMDDDEARVLSDGYSSLLDLSRPVAARPQFVRIEEPEDEEEAIEPVVVFPGQAARTTAAPFAPPPFAPPVSPAPAPRQPVSSQPEPAPAPRLAVQNDPAPPRRFDAPPTGASGVQPAPQQDPEEAERALRAALATLQRMSASA